MLTATSNRSLSILSQLPSRPTAIPSTAVRAIAADIPTTTAFTVQLPALSLLQVRGAKRDTYDPSHRVRKRRHGFLSRLRSKNGRNTLKRRKLRGRNTLSH
jgi:large subunit ribosomal protein L34